jgi:glycosyltransferase involved in cell wall biosynthesis
MTRLSVTAVIAVFNGEEFLGRAIESVLAERYEPLGVVVVDDGSTDGSARVASSYPVTLIRQENRGPGPARNAGVAASESDLLLFVDADDEMVPGRIAAHAAVFAERPDVGAVIGRMDPFVDGGLELPQWARPDRRFNAPGGAAVGSPMYRRTSFDRVGGFDPGLFVSEDLDLLFRLREANVSIEFSDLVVVRKRIHGRNLTYQSAAIEESIFRSIRGRIHRGREADHER